ncbi:MAG: SPFH domain-containing protein [Limisphaerales bacterium]
MATIGRPKLDPASDEWFVWKYPSEVLRLGAQLSVGQNEEVVLVKAGRALDLFAPGKHTLSASNLPLLDQTISFSAQQRTQFAAEIWFVHTQAKRDIRWETKAPISITDPVYNFPVSIQCQGRWGGRVHDSRAFLTQLAATLKDSGLDKVEEHLTGLIVKRFSDLLSNYFVRGKTSVLEAHAKLNELSSFIAENLRPEFSQFGWELPLFQVDQLSMPDETMKKLQELLAQKMEGERLSQPPPTQPAAAMRGFSPTDTGFGYAPRPGAAAPAPPPAQPAPSVGSQDPVVKLKKLKQLLDGGLITQQDFDTRKQKILDEL